MIVAVDVNAIAEISDDEIEALSVAAWSQGRGCDPLIRLLRKLAPGDETLKILDARARQNGYVKAGSDESIKYEPTADDREACAGGGLPASVSRTPFDAY